jgi:hypothetical protein
LSCADAVCMETIGIAAKASKIARPTRIFILPEALVG